MKMSQFQPLLLKAAVNLIACDGTIADVEIQELKSIAESEMYFSEFEYQDLLTSFVSDIKQRGKDSINDFLSELGSSEPKERQKFIMLEVLIRIMESDNVVDTNEMKFLHLVKSKLNLSDEELIMQFPDKLELLLENNTESFQTEFTDDIKFEEHN